MIYFFILLDIIEDFIGDDEMEDNYIENLISAHSEFDKNFRIDGLTLLKILTGNYQKIFLVEKDENSLKEKIRTYRYFPNSFEFRHYFPNNTSYHRIILNDLLRGKDAKEKELKCFFSEEEAILFAEITN